MTKRRRSNGLVGRMIRMMSLKGMMNGNINWASSGSNAWDMIRQMELNDLD